MLLCRGTTAMPSILAMDVTGSHRCSLWPGLLVNVLMFRIDALNLILEQALGDAVGVAQRCFAGWPPT